MRCGAVRCKVMPGDAVPGDAMRAMRSRHRGWISYIYALLEVITSTRVEHSTLLYSKHFSVTVVGVL